MATIAAQLETNFIPTTFHLTILTLPNVSSLRNKILPLPKLRRMLPDVECYSEVNNISETEFRTTVTCPVRFACHLVLLNTSYNVLYHKEMTARISSLKSKSGSQLYDCVFLLTHQEDKIDDRLGNLPNDTLVLWYILGILRNSVSRPLSSCIDRARKHADYLKDLATRMKCFPDSFLDQKITLCVGMDTTTVQKSVLCASSPVFAKMFENEMLENIEDTVTIQDIEMPVLNKLIQSLYSGIVYVEGVEQLCSLYYAADKYDIAALRVGCRKLLLHEITVYNASRLFKLSCVHNDERLKSSVVSFFGNHLNSILLTKGWLEMMNNGTRIALEAIATFNVNSGK